MPEGLPPEREKIGTASGPLIGPDSGDLFGVKSALFGLSFWAFQRGDPGIGLPGIGGTTGTTLVKSGLVGTSEEERWATEPATLTAADDAPGPSGEAEEDAAPEEAAAAPGAEAEEAVVP